MTKTNLKNLSQKSCYLILGFGLTGEALANYFESQKQFYWIWDDQKKITKENPFFLGQISEHDLSQDLAKMVHTVLPSPGAPQDHPLLQWAQTQTLPILSEIEWAASRLDGNFIGVTGTNGKSTTVKLINELLSDAGLNSAIFGNYGSPLIQACAEPQFSYYVLEESSYQLEWIQHLHHRIAICLNVTADHLDRYGHMQAYADAKENIIKNSTPDDLFIYNYDNPFCLKMQKQSKAKNLPFSLTHSFDEGAFLEKDQNLVIRLQNEEFVFPLKDCRLKGWHNIENMLAALLACLSIQKQPSTIASYKKTLANFQGLPHRMEWIDEQNEVTFYDDSKATNVDSVAMALTCFEKNVILIAGGQDKGGDYSLLKGLIKEKVKTLIAIGEAQQKIKTAFANSTQVIEKNNLEDAVTFAKQIAKPGDVVLLSPACSSFDQFQNYKERGLAFQKFVKS